MLPWDFLVPCAIHTIIRNWWTGDGAGKPSFKSNKLRGFGEANATMIVVQEHIIISLMSEIRVALITQSGEAKVWVLCRLYLLKVHAR